MQTIPTAADMIEAVAEWLEGPAGSALSGAERYNARVAARALRGVERELRAGADYFEAERSALSVFVPISDPRTPVAELSTALATDIREGRLDSQTSELIAALHRYTLRQLLLVNPKYVTASDRTDATATELR